VTAVSEHAKGIITTLKAIHWLAKEELLPKSIFPGKKR